MTFDVTELALLAKHLPTITGRAINPEPRDSRATHDGRPDTVDEVSSELRRAVIALGRLETLYRLDRGACFVVWSTYVHHAGSARNAHWNRVLALRSMTPAARFESMLRSPLSGRGAEAFKLDSMGRAMIAAALEQLAALEPVRSSGAWVAEMTARCSTAEQELARTQAQVDAKRRADREALKRAREGQPNRAARRAARRSA